MKTFERKYSLTPVDVPAVDTPNRRIQTQVPVPESIPYLQRLEKAEPASMQGQPPILIDRSQAYHVYDKWGNKWMDWSSGVLITNVGNAHPEICASIKEMLERPLLATYVFPHEKRVELAESLQSIAPDDSYKVFLLSTGSEATENCIKLSKTYGMENHGPEKRYIISFSNGFHGRTMAAQLAGGSPALKKWLGKTDDSFVQVPFPDGYFNEDTSFEVFLKTLDENRISGEDVCGVIVESYQGAGPFFMPTEYAQKLEAWCRENDVILTLDEVQAGFGRTGKMFTFEHYGIKPDLIACGKGISSSLALSAVIGREEVMEFYAPGSMTSTHSGSPLPVAAAVANLKLLKEGNFIENAVELGKILEAGLREIAEKYPENAAHVTSVGMVAGIQMAKPGTRDTDAATALEINLKCFQKGLLMFAPVGVGGSCIKIAPPLDTTKEALLEGLSVLSEAFDEVLG